jgi:hypothetical protein
MSFLAPAGGTVSLTLSQSSTLNKTSSILAYPSAFVYLFSSQTAEGLVSAPKKKCIRTLWLNHWHHLLSPPTVCFSGSKPCSPIFTKLICYMAFVLHILVQILYTDNSVIKFNMLTVQNTCKIYVTYLKIQAILFPFCATGWLQMPIYAHNFLPHTKGYFQALCQCE